jgi:hypothetical protein
MHGARFDIKTGKKISDPTMPSINTDSLPPNFQKYVQYAGQILSRIKTYDQKTYEVKIEGNNMGDLDSLMTLIEADSCFVSQPGQLAEIVRA